MKPRVTLTILVAAVLSALVWALSPAFTAHAEPWDASGWYYLSALAIVGAISGTLLPKTLWAHYLGAVLGQVMYELLFLRVGPLFLLGVVFLLGYSIVFLAAAAVAAIFRLPYTSGPNVA
jgi:hypothetical protein